jgi:serine/threonine protein kinase
MHEVSIIHGDIKPANILWEKTPDKGLVGKFTDFGFTFDPRISLHFTLETQGFYGSVTPTAPEVLRSPSPFSGDCFAAEMWALGYSLFLPMFGELPPWGSKILAHREGKDGCSAKDFPDIIEQMIRHEIQKRQRLLEGWTSRRASLAHICLSMLSINPLERPTAAQAEQRVREVREKTFIPRV